MFAEIVHTPMLNICHLWCKFMDSQKYTFWAMIQTTLCSANEFLQNRSCTRKNFTLNFISYKCHH